MMTRPYTEDDRNAVRFALTRAGFDPDLCEVKEAVLISTTGEETVIVHVPVVGGSTAPINVSL